MSDDDRIVNRAIGIGLQSQIHHIGVFLWLYIFFH